MPIDVVISLIINNKNNTNSVYQVNTLGDYCNLYLSWMSLDSIYTIAFEKLVGPKVGRTLENQLEEIQNIAKHIKCKINISRASQIAESLFGGTYTFREEKIGA